MGYFDSISTEKNNKYSNCKRTKILKRRLRGKASYLKHLVVCIEEYSTPIFLDEAGAFGSNIGTFLNDMARETRKQNATTVMATVSLGDYK